MPAKRCATPWCAWPWGSRPRCDWASSTAFSSAEAVRGLVATTSAQWLSGSASTSSRSAEVAMTTLSTSCAWHRGCNCARVCRPLWPGMRQSTSSTLQCGQGPARSRASASSPLLNVSTPQPRERAACCSARRAASLSSTTSTRCAAKAGGAAPADASRPNSRVNEKLLPTPGTLCTCIVPPMSCTSLLLMVRPRPVPPKFRVVELSAWEKGLKMCSSLSAAMPTPVSRTTKRKPQRFGALLGTCSMPSTTSPRGVNLTALLARFSSTWPRRKGSPRSASAPAGTAPTTTSSSFLPTEADRMPARLSRMSERRKGTSSICSCLASILEKSRMSLTMLSSELPELVILRTRSRASGPRSCFSSK